MLTWSQVKEAAAHGVELAGHSHSHPQLDQIGDAALREELSRNKALLEDELGKPVTTMAYPYGYSNARVRRAVAAAGYEAACAVDNALAARAARPVRDAAADRGPQHHHGQVPGGRRGTRSTCVVPEGADPDQGIRRGPPNEVGAAPGRGGAPRHDAPFLSTPSVAVAPLRGRYMGRPSEVEHADDCGPQASNSYAFRPRSRNVQTAWKTAHTPNARSFVTTRVGGQGGHPASYWGWCMYGSVIAAVLLCAVGQRLAPVAVRTSPAPSFRIAPGRVRGPGGCSCSASRCGARPAEALPAQPPSPCASCRAGRSDTARRRSACWLRSL